MPIPKPDFESKPAFTAKLWYLIFISIILLWYFRECHLYSVVALDVSVFLVCAQQLLDGQKLFLHIFETNPPLIYYISTIPMLLSNASGLEPAYAFVICVVAIAAASLTLSTLVLRHASEDVRYVGGAMLAACFIGMIFSAQNIFGQREELFVLLYLPFFFLRWLRSLDRNVGLPLAVCTGIIAGIGSSIKPQFVFIVLCVELAFLVQYRRFSTFKAPEVMACFAVGIVYLFHLIFWDPAALHYFIAEHVPTVLKYYLFANCSVFTVLLVKKANNTFVLMLLSAIWAAFFFRRDKFIPVLLAWVASSYFLFVIQMKGWAYHAAPLVAGVHMMLAALFVITLRYFFERRADKDIDTTNTDAISRTKRAGQFLTVYSMLQVVLLAILVLGVVTTSLYYPHRKSGQAPDLVPVDQLFSQYTVYGDSVALLSLDSRRLAQLLLVHRLRFGWRYAWGYPIRFLIHEEKTGREKIRVQAAWDKLLRTALDDVQTRKPRLILIDRFVKDKLNKLGLLDQIVSNYNELNTIIAPVEPGNSECSVYVSKDPKPMR